MTLYFMKMRVVLWQVMGISYFIFLHIKMFKNQRLDPVAAETRARR